MSTVIHYAQRGNGDRNQRWDRIQRADLVEQLRGLQAQGVSQRQAAKVLDVPRSTLQAWRAYQESLDACPAVVAFFHRVPGLAFLHRLVLALHVVFVELGACGIRLVCLVLELTGRNRFVGASYGTQQQINRHVEEAMVTYQREETARLAEQRPPNASRNWGCRSAPVYLSVSTSPYARPWRLWCVRVGASGRIAPK